MQCKIIEGMAQLTDTVTAFPPPKKHLIIELSTSHPERFDTQSTLTIPAGIESIPFDFSIVDDSFLNGTSNVHISAATTDYFSTPAIMSINDNEPAVLSIIFPESANESDNFVEGKMNIIN